MSVRYWLVTYTDRKEKIGTVIIEWPSIPTREHVAIRIREHLLGENYLLVDTPRSHPEPTIFLLQSYGFHITNVEETIPSDNEERDSL